MASSPFDPFLLENGFVVLDGGLATELEAQGADLTGDLWSAGLLANDPSLILKTHLAYYRAGADVGISASYQASFEGFLRKGFNRDKAAELVCLSVRLTVRARDQFWREYQEQQQQEKNQEKPRPASRLKDEDGKYVTPTTTAPAVATGVTVAAPSPLALPLVVEPVAALPKPQERSSSDSQQLQSSPSHRTPAITTATTTTTTTTITTEKTTETVPRCNHGKYRRLRPLVAASLGCYGAALADGSEYRGDYGDRVGQSGLKEWHRERLELLAGQEGVDLFIFETIPCLVEVRAILSLLQDLRLRVSVVISVTCRDGQHLRSGERVQDFADLIWPHRAAETGAFTSGIEEKSAATVAPACVVGVGVNCTAPKHVAGALRTLSEAISRSTTQQQRGSSDYCCASSGLVPASGVDEHPTAQRKGGEATHITGSEMKGMAINVAELVSSASRKGQKGAFVPPPIVLVAYPNSGEEWDASARDWVEGTGLRDVVEESDAGGGRGGAEEFGSMVRDEWYTAGQEARVFGGCCRTRPAHINEIRRVLSAACVEGRSAR